MKPYHFSKVLLTGLAIVALFAVPAAAATLTWDDGDPGDHSWGTATNWSGDAAVPGIADTAKFLDDTFGDVTLDGDQGIKILQIQATANGSIASGSGGTLSLATKINRLDDTTGDDGAVTITAPILLTAASTVVNNVNAGSGLLTISGGITGGKTLGFSSTTGQETWLGGANTLSTVTVTTGTLVLNNTSGSGYAIPAGLTIATGGTVKLNADNQIDGGALSLTGGAVLDLNGHTNGAMGNLIMRKVATTPKTNAMKKASILPIR